VNNSIHSLRHRRVVILSTSILITLLYWILALWYTNKSAQSKDLLVFHTLFGSYFFDSGWIDFWQYIYQFALTVLLFWLVPYLIATHYLKLNFSDLGLTWKPNKEAISICVVAYPLVIASTYFSSQDPLIAAEYPLTKLISKSWLIFLVYQCTYFFYFLSYEIFYRGYLMFGLKSEDAPFKQLLIIVIVQTVLTTLFHIGKPMPEVIAAAAFGPVFGYVAFRYQNIWYGMAIHFIMNVFLDSFSLRAHHLLPSSFL
jgi:membrane protease YdiL (CAAX protease family)